LTGEDLKRIYGRRSAKGWKERLRRALEPPAPYVMNPREEIHAPLGRWNLCIGGGGRSMPGYVNLDLFVLPGVDVTADAGQLPFPEGIFQRVECDAVLEHVRDPRRVMSEIRRVLAPGGYAHIVTPFCHPFHEYPRDFRRFSPDGLKEIAAGLEVVAEGWRTGPTATLLVFLLEYGKLLLPWRVWRMGVHMALGWALFPLRYLDLPLFHARHAGRIGNHCFVWLRKPVPE
jgi:SAM-dependent methyltransferase